MLPKLHVELSTWATHAKRFYHYLRRGNIEYNLDAYREILARIEQFRSYAISRTDQQLKDWSARLRRQAPSQDNLDPLLPEAFALVQEVIWRTLDIQPYPCQLIGGIVLHQGKLAEMQTGEGKTLMALFPAYLNALTGKGVHVFTVNDYLARRDAQRMGPVYEFLGISVAFIQEGMSHLERQRAYGEDVTYLTAKEAGFDYLRDGLCFESDEQVHRPFHYAIIDEADSILLDEARIPLTIAGTFDEESPLDSEGQLLLQMAELARALDPTLHIGFDTYACTAHLTEQGIHFAEAYLKRADLFDGTNAHQLARLHCALYAEYLLQKDVDYIVRHGTVELVDEVTGRIADKRRWPDGIQEAIEAKEGLTIQSRGTILNSIALQYFLQRYPRCCGMTATAESAKEEFGAFYGLNVVVIPPNQPCIRQDHPDRIFPTEEAKQQAIVKEVASVHAAGRPILVGTLSIQESVQIAAALHKEGIPCQVLNAKQDDHEAQIIAQAGRIGAVTISTNMAGRGTDIRLQDTAELGGLYVIGTNRHESQRIDSQLRGRAGRQGDPGSSQFFISLEDDLFIKYRLKELLPESSNAEGSTSEIINPTVRKKIDRLQRIIVGQNLTLKKTLVKYTYLVEQQRQIVHQRRRMILEGNDPVLPYHTQSPQKVQQLLDTIGEERLTELCQRLSLLHLDRAWSYHLEDVADIREGIYLFRVGKLDPLLEFHKRIVERFGVHVAEFRGRAN